MNPLLLAIPQLVNGVTGLVKSFSGAAQSKKSDFNSVLGGLTQSSSGDPATNTALSEINPQYMNLIQEQMAQQQQSQLVNMVSNVIKSEHETRMAPIRNARIG